MKNNYYFIKVNQNIDFNMYVGKINILDLYEIHEVDPINEKDEGIDTENPKDFLNNWLLVQRNERKDRITEISNYVSEWVIPNSIILWNEKNNSWIDFKLIDNWLYKLEIKEKLNKKEKLFVIDGQHRLKWAALYTYKIILKKILKNNIDNEQLYKKLLSIEKIKNYFDKIEKIKKVISDNDLYEIYNDKDINIIDFSVVILDNLSTDKIVEIFTDINSSQKPLDSNIYRYYYWRFTTKFPYLNISVNIAKLLNENKNSSLYGLFKMPYVVKYYEENLKWFSRVWVWAFCERFNWVSEIKNIDLYDFDNNYFKKSLGIFINHNLLNWTDKIIISDNSIVKSIKILFTFMIYSYGEINNLYIELLKNEWITKESENYNRYKFIDSTTNELYFNVIRYLVIFFIKDYKYNIEEIFNLSKDEIKKSIQKNFINVKESLKYIYIKYDYFKKWENQWTGQAKSNKVIKEFEKRIDIINSDFSKEFNRNIKEYYSNI